MGDAEEAAEDDLNKFHLGCSRFQDTDVSGASDAYEALKIVDRNLPAELNYRGHVLFDHYSFGFDEFELRVEFDLQNPIFPIKCVLENYSLPRTVFESLRESLWQIAYTEIIAAKSHFGLFTAALLTLQLLDVAIGHLRQYRFKKSNHEPTAVRTQMEKKSKQEGEKKRWNLNETNNIVAILNANSEMVGLDLNSVHGAATHILGKTPAQICDDILPGWSILHCENILRHDLQSRFLHYQKDLRESLMKESISTLQKFVPPQYHRNGLGHSGKEQLLDYLIKPRVTFHGTARRNVASIVQAGFIIPGHIDPATKLRIPIRNGTALGIGIYMSPQAWYALNFSDRGEMTEPCELPGLKLIICASIMGRTAQVDYEDGLYDQTEPWRGTDSHVNPNGLQYVLFDSAAVLPCYVLHLDWGQKDAKDIGKFLTQVSNGSFSASSRSRKRVDAYIAPGDVQRRKQELIAKGKKFFAYGFGSYNGKNIVIEDVADVSDDEEDYGRYQEARIQTKEERSGFWDWGEPLEGVTVHDEYALARRAKGNKMSEREREELMQKAN